MSTTSSKTCVNNHGKSEVYRMCEVHLATKLVKTLEWHVQVNTMLDGTTSLTLEQIHPAELKTYLLYTWHIPAISHILGNLQKSWLVIHFPSPNSKLLGNIELTTVTPSHNAVYIPPDPRCSKSSSPSKWKEVNTWGAFFISFARAAKAVLLTSVVNVLPGASYWRAR